jgi:hypothetical protein
LAGRVVKVVDDTADDAYDDLETRMAALMALDRFGREPPLSGRSTGTQRARRRILDGCDGGDEPAVRGPIRIARNLSRGTLGTPKTGHGRDADMSKQVAATLRRLSLTRKNLPSSGRLRA